MFQQAKPLFLIARTPLHAGAGSDLGYIDLPIQREKHTGFPKVEASSLKGALREVFEKLTSYKDASNTEIKVSKKEVELSFGPESGDSHAGALGFTDARLLLFPMKSLKGIFAWVTCPMVLEKFKNELDICHLSPNADALKEALPVLSSKISIGDISVLGINDKVILEEYSLSIDVEPETKAFADALGTVLSIPDLDKRLIVLDNETFTDFIKMHTEVISRIVIGKSGTADNLFNEEFLPAESVLYSLVLASPIFQSDDNKKGIFNPNGGIEKDYEKMLQYFKYGLKPTFQLGGDATLGKGIMRSITTLI
jgi:CRISPR-associated protein Cmr4